MTKEKIEGFSEAVAYYESDTVAKQMPRQNKVKLN